MIKVTLIVGLPGSGKTTYAKSLLSDDMFLIDDPNKDKTLFDQAIASGKSHILLCDPLLIGAHMKRVEDFLKGKFDQIEFDWIYFENDPDAAWLNHLERNKTDPRDISRKWFDKLSEQYVIPEGSVVMPVYKGHVDV